MCVAALIRVQPFDLNLKSSKFYQDNCKMIINATLINNNFSSKSEPTHKPNIADIASTLPNHQNQQATASFII
jgi:hypothetical protein